MKITMYELLGLVKNNKAPKKIKYNGYIFKYTGDKSIQRLYVIEKQENYLLNYLLRDFIISLNSEVEIIEEKKEIPDKLDLSDYIEITSKNDMKYEMFEHIFNKNANTFFTKINEIIDYLNSKGE